MPRYNVTLTEEEEQFLKDLVQKGGKGYQIRHAQILLKLNKKPENTTWSYERIKEAFGGSHSTIACSSPPEGRSRWTMQAIADELIRLEVVDYITDTTVCNVMKKTKSSRGL